MSAATKLPVLMKPTQVAEWLGCSRKEIYNKVSRGVFPPEAIVKLGTQLMFDEARLRQWVEANRGSGSHGIHDPSA
ncbi:MAG TPA: helix-turn-helix domain-containing protein [Polyangiales bacterium]|nr:helix-turn-helix domain-containing protein [Polyangiales bacterium]